VLLEARIQMWRHIQGLERSEILSVTVIPANESSQRQRPPFAQCIRCTIVVCQESSTIYQDTQRMRLSQDQSAKNYLFESIAESDMAKLITAFEKLVVTVDDETAIEGENGTVFVDLIHQGESADKDTVYFYIIYLGKCRFPVNGKTVGWANPGDFFGELSLLYDCPRVATVTAVIDSKDNVSTQPASSGNLLQGGVVLFRVHQRGFRAVLQHADQVSGIWLKNEIAGRRPFSKGCFNRRHRKACIRHEADSLSERLHKGEAGCSTSPISLKLDDFPFLQMV
jgi:Cyclic nucleotide-binding domain